MWWGGGFFSKYVDAGHSIYNYVIQMTLISDYHFLHTPVCNCTKIQCSVIEKFRSSIIEKIKRIHW